MKHLTSFSFLIFLLGLILSPTFEVNAAAPGSETGGIQQAEPTDQDREYCASMIRFGKEAFQRGRYLDAKQFFRQAIEADRTNSKAWLYYDRTVIFALAEKVEQGSSLWLPEDPFLLQKTLPLSKQNRQRFLWCLLQKMKKRRRKRKKKAADAGL